jgi:hypothetical protein
MEGAQETEAMQETQETEETILYAKTKKGMRRHIVRTRDSNGQAEMYCGKLYKEERLYQASDAVRVCRPCQREFDREVNAEAEHAEEPEGEQVESGQVETEQAETEQEQEQQP